MNKQFFINLSLLAYICILFSSCAKYNAKPLNKLSTEILFNEEQEEAVSFAYKIFNKKDCKKYLDRNVISKGYVPIQITFTNNSKRSLHLSLTNFSLPHAFPEQVSKTVHTSTAKRALGYGIIGLFIWPFLIPAIIDGLGSSEANSELDCDFRRKVLRDQLINPWDTVNGLIFVPQEDFRRDFIFTLTDSNNSERFVFASNKSKLKIDKEWIS